MTPAFMYGTAWKEEETATLTRLALEQGFRAIDTANQRRHYHEARVGEALAGAYADGLVRREGLFLQTKFTYQGGQDNRLPYDPHAHVATQVRQSVASSLEHLGTTYLDAYLLHGPYSRDGWTHLDQVVWETMQELHAEGTVHRLGVSNVGLDQLQQLCEQAQVPPAIVQNRCFANRLWDARVRGYCKQKGLMYQGFSLLTANSRELINPKILEMARRLQLTVPQIVFRFAVQVGMLPLTGTSQAEHMRQDLQVFGLELSEEDLATVLHIGV